LAEFRRRILWSGLPKTIQDAIEITRRLSIGYIWIDCLCIVQDDPNDWSQEAFKMCEYYEKAFVTIAASGGTDVHSGILLGRDSVSAPKRLRCPEAGNMGNEVLVQEHPDLRPNKWINYPNAEVFDRFGPLSDRAWAFQENALSTRILHYTQSGLIWECRSELLSETRHAKWFFTGRCIGLAQNLSRTLEGQPDSVWRDMVSE
jgi:Heterokaryon incompatibility protein (HET)